MRISEAKTFNLNGNEYVFTNDSGSNRCGFYHRSILYVNGNRKAENKVNYLNRTWEVYRYQTAMKGLVSKLMSDRLDRLEYDFKKANKYRRMTDKRRVDFEKVTSADSLLLEYKELYSKL